MSIRSIDAADAKRRLHEGGEVALLDVREAAAFGEGHALFAVPCPYGRIEVLTIALVPNPRAPLLLIDDGDGVAERAARRLLACGYTDISIVEGGMPAWAAAGFGVFAGVNVPSKTLGELLEHAHHPRMIDAATLHAWKAEGRPHLFFDTRPPEEFAKMRIEGARCLPNGELAHRFAHVVPDDQVPVVVTCAGRTRGIVGALGLAAAGIANPVFALENGTQGWALAGFALDRGAKPDEFPVLDGREREVSRRRTEAILARGHLQRLPVEAIAPTLADPERTTYAFDLRSAPERAARPCAAAVPVLAGQIVQATDQYVGVRHARLVLIDDTGLRAALTGLFLHALGFEPFVVVLDDDPSAALPQQRAVNLKAPQPPEPVPAGEARERLSAEGVVLVDLRPSQAWEAGRLAGARWMSRRDLPGGLPVGTREVIVHATDRATAASAALDLQEGGIVANWLAADLGACEAAGWSVERETRVLTREEAVDRIWFTHDRHDGNREASLRYLSWEMGLIGQLDAEESAEFGAFNPPAA